MPADIHLPPRIGVSHLHSQPVFLQNNKNIGCNNHLLYLRFLGVKNGTNEQASKYVPYSTISFNT